MCQFADGSATAELHPAGCCMQLVVQGIQPATKAFTQYSNSRNTGLKHSAAIAWPCMLHGFHKQAQSAVA
jgi:hypothetical protein